MASPPNFEPFDESVPLFKVCAKCRIKKKTTKEFWYGARINRTFEVPDGFGDSMLEVRRIHIPRGYCRDCTNLTKRSDRIVKKVIAAETDPDRRAEFEAMRRGDCGVCHRAANQRSTLPTHDGIVVVCTQCRAFIDESRATPDSIAHALSRASQLTRHLADEKAAERRMLTRTNLTYIQPHKYNPKAKGIFLPHIVCIAIELSWRKVYQFLLTEDR